MSNKQKRNTTRPHIPTTPLFNTLPPELADTMHIQVVVDALPVGNQLSKEDGDRLVAAIKETLDKFNLPLAANINANSHPLHKCTVISCIYLRNLVEVAAKTNEKPPIDKTAVEAHRTNLERTANKFSKLPKTPEEIPGQHENIEPLE